MSSEPRVVLRRRTYNWARWANGLPWVLEEGEPPHGDFLRRRNFVSSTYSWARHHNACVVLEQVALDTDNGVAVPCVQLQFRWDLPYGFLPKPQFLVVDRAPVPWGPGCRGQMVWQPPKRHVAPLDGQLPANLVAT